MPKKNIKLLAGKPLIQYTIDAAKALFKEKEILVSTDDVEIKDTVEKLGIDVPFLRPMALSTDSSSTYDVLLHALDYCEQGGTVPETLVLLQPTSPFRTKQHIEEAFSLYQNEKDVDMVVSVCESKANPYYNLFEEDNRGFLKQSKPGTYTRRQEVPKVWEYNGAIYVINVQSLRKRPIRLFNKVKKYIMPYEASIDIDTPFDWTIAEALMTYSSNSGLD